MNNKMMQLGELKERVEEFLDDLVPNTVWSQLKAQGFIKRHVGGEMSFNELLAQVRFGIGVFRGGTGSHAPVARVIPRSEQETDHGDDLRSLRRWALSLILAQEAREDPQVIDFREAALPDALLESGQVERWIERKASEDGEPTWWLTDMAIPKGYVRVLDRETSKNYVDPELRISAETGADGARLKLLRFTVESDGWERAQPVAFGGVLERLKQTADYLANRFSWAESQAVGFLLTDGVPLVDLIRRRTSIRRPYRGLSRVTLTLDPTLTPREVSNEYREARRGLVGGRYRSPGEKHLRLAIFHAQQTKTKRWKERMAAWNKEVGDRKWKYSLESNFRRDCAKAQARLLEPNFRLAIATGGTNSASQDLDDG